MKIAVFCPNWVGDMVMATPALRGVRRRYPKAEIVGVLRPYVAGVLEGLDLVDRLLFHDPVGGTGLLARPSILRQANKPVLQGEQTQPLRGWQFARRLRRERFDLVLVLPNSLRSGFWAWMSGAKRRVGFDRNGRGWMLTDPVAPRPHSVPRPVIDDYLLLASHLDCSGLSRRMELATTPADERRLRDVCNGQRIGEYAARGVVCLNPGGAFGSAKHWPAASFAELARRIATELSRRVLVLCGPAERDEAREIVRLAGHPAVVSLADERPSLGLTKAAVRHAELLVTTDSGPRHFAQPFQVPVVTLFGPTHTAWSETFYEQSLHLQSDVECGPCQQRVCPLQHHRCMRDLGTGWVFKAAAFLLEKYPARVRAA
jgi:heptosyltransferase-2